MSRKLFEESPGLSLRTIILLLQIFDLRWAFAEMEHQSKSARLAVVAQAAAVAGYPPPTNITPSLIEHAGTGVDDLRRVSILFLLFFAISVLESAVEVSGAEI